MRGDANERNADAAPPQTPDHAAPAGFHGLTHCLLLAVAYWAATLATLHWAVAPGDGVVAWIPAALALAALTAGGARLWPGVFLGHLAASLTSGPVDPVAADLILATGATLSAAAPVLALRWLRVDARLTTVGSVLWLIACGGIAGGVICVAAGALAWLAGGTLFMARNAVPMWGFGYMVAILTLTPVLLSWRAGAGQRFDLRTGLHLAVAMTVTAAVAYVIFLLPDIQTIRSWFVFPLLVWPALAFSLRGASLGVLIIAVAAFAADIQNIGPFTGPPAGATPTLFTQQFVIMVAATIMILAAVADERRGRDQLRASERRLREESEALEILNRTGAAIAAELDLDAAVQKVTDAGVTLAGAEFGAFFYNEIGEQGASYMLYALSGAPRSAFETFGQPRNTAVFAPTFRGETPVRVDDITQDPRYGHNPPHRGMPVGHLPVRSYLAVPVRLRSGEVAGGLFFGHSRPGVFDARSERLIVGVATQAAVAIDNARLYQAAQRELAERRRAEEHQRLLMNELNHRVKNTMSTIQAMSAQTLRPGRSLAEAREALVSRIVALSTAHNLLTEERWESADLRDLVRMSAAPFDEPSGARFTINGPSVRLKATHAVAIAMALYELGTNATKYGALSSKTGHVTVTWTRSEADDIRFVWEERGGPVVQPPVRKGFGSRLIREGLMHELRAQVTIGFQPEGLRYELAFRLEPPSPGDADIPGLDA